jgi:hypothetical protein
MDRDTEIATTHDRLGHGIIKRKRTVISLAAVITVAAALLFVNSHRIDSAPGAENPKCSEVIDRSPDRVAAESRDWAIGRGVASWGDRTTVLRCGVAEAAPTVDLCVTVDGVDWVLDEKQLHATGVSVLTTYGRTPAIQVTYSGARENVGGVLVQLQDSVAWIKQKRKCIDYADTL